MCAKPWVFNTGWIAAADKGGGHRLVCARERQSAWSLPASLLCCSFSPVALKPAALAGPEHRSRCFHMCSRRWGPDSLKVTGGCLSEQNPECDADAPWLGSLPRSIYDYCFLLKILLHHVLFYLFIFWPRCAACGILAP